MRREVRPFVQVVCPHRGAQAEVRGVRSLQHIVNVSEGHDRKRRAELLFVNQSSAFGDVCNNRGRVEISWPVEAFAASGDGRACPLSVRHQFGHPVKLRRVVDWPELRGGVHTVADPYAFGEVGEFLNQRRIHPLMYVEALDRDTDLPCILECVPEQLLCYPLRVHIVEHDSRVVAAELEHDTLEVGGCGGGDSLASLDRAGKGDFTDCRVRRDGRSQLVPA